MTNGSLRPPQSDVNSPPRAARRVAAASALFAITTVLAQEEPLEVTLRVLDDVSHIEGVLMPLEEKPAHRTDADSAPAPAPEPSSPAEPAEEVKRSSLYVRAIS